MFDTDKFIEDCKRAYAEDESHKAVREVVVEAVSDPVAIVNALGEPTEAGFSPLYHSDDLTILNFAWAPLMTMMPHNHNMWAVIGLYRGQEDNTFYTRNKEGAGLIRTRGQELHTHDAIALAKGLGGGFPIGSVWVSEPYADLFTPGSHGTTFGGSPLACAAAHAVLDVIEEEGIIKKVNERSESFKNQLKTLAENHPELVQEVRGRGYLLALAMKVPGGDAVDSLREGGLITVPAGGDAVRLLPPLNVTDGELDEALRILDEVFSNFQRNPDK